MGWEDLNCWVSRGVFCLSLHALSLSAVSLAWWFPCQRICLQRENQIEGLSPDELASKAMQTYFSYLLLIRASQLTQQSRIRLPMQETQERWVQSLGQEDPLEEEMATLSSILAWRIPLPEEPGGLQSMGSQRVRHDWAHMHEHTCTSTHAQLLTRSKSLRPAPCLKGRESDLLVGVVSNHVQTCVKTTTTLTGTVLVFAHWSGVW